MKTTQSLTVVTPLVSRILSLHEEILGAARNSVPKAIQIGKLLTEQKAAIKHGEWLKWMKDNLPFSQQTVSNYMRLFDNRDKLPIVGNLELTDAYRLLAGGKAHVSHNSGNNEWYTPKDFAEAARQAMGGIDCDPASSPIANKIIKAKVFFTKDDNGLKQKWQGRVFLNPPYAQPHVRDFAVAVADKFKTKEFEQACVLINNATETDWFARIAAVSSAICFPASRVKFLDPDGNPGAPLQGQAVLYLGKRRQQFAKAFADFGFLCYVQ